MNQFDKTSLQTLRVAMIEALDTVAKNHGVKFELGNISYTPTSCKIKLSAAVIDTLSGVAETRERTNFKIYAPTLGLKREWLDKSFGYLGYQFVVVGLRPQSWKRPVLVQRNDGKIFKFTAETVRLLLKDK